MKTLILAVSIMVTSGSKQITLNQSQIDYLSTHGTRTVKEALVSSKDIRNVAAADQIFKFLGK